MVPAGYCEPCLWEVRAEVDYGLDRLAEYLGHWAQFTDWCDDEGRAAA